jgi:lysylphosphatidylglycerol synthetase-like protein (DUF2156 family)
MTEKTQQVQQTQTSQEPSMPPFDVLTPRWAVILGALAFGVIYAALPNHVTIVPNWLPLVLEAVLLIPLVLAGIIGRPLRHIFTRVLGFALLAVITIALMGGVILFVGTLTAGKNLYTPIALLRTAALLWAANVLVFALWYWEIDGGGPRTRHLNEYKAADFMFPQQTEGNPDRWVPHFFDYLFVAFTGATALSPTDTFPLTRTTKILMMIEALNAMSILVIIVGRVVNIL